MEILVEHADWLAEACPSLLQLKYQLDDEKVMVVGKRKFHLKGWVSVAELMQLEPNDAGQFILTAEGKSLRIDGRATLVLPLVENAEPAEMTIEPPKPYYAEYVKPTLEEWGLLTGYVYRVRDEMDERFCTVDGILENGKPKQFFRIRFQKLPPLPPDYDMEKSDDYAFVSPERLMQWQSGASES